MVRAHRASDRARGKAAARAAHNRGKKWGKPAPNLPTLGWLGHCWCGEPNGHDWPGRDEGKPHPR